MKIMMAVLLCVTLVAPACAGVQNDDIDAEPETHLKCASRDLEQYENLDEYAVNSGAEEKYEAFWHVFENELSMNSQVADALANLKQAAAAGHTDAQYNLGFLFATGKWVAQDYELALDWLIPAAQAGHPRAKLWSGQIYLNLYFRADNDSDKDACFFEMESQLRDLISADSKDGRIELAASEMLGSALLAKSIRNPEGWSLVEGAASSGYEPAVKTLLELRTFLTEQVAGGYEPARSFLNDLREFLQSEGIDPSEGKTDTR